MRRTISIALLTAMLLPFAGRLPAHAQKAELLPQGADKDKDGFLTLEEVRAHLGGAAPPVKRPRKTVRPETHCW